MKTKSQSQKPQSKDNQTKQLPKSFRLSPSDLNKLQTLLDFIFPDQTKFYTDFPHFEECFNYLNNPESQKKFSLFDIYKEIVGPSKKYLTVPRFINSYIDFKSFQKNISLPLKQFFSYIMSSLLKDNVGSDLKGKVYTSTNFKNYNRLSKLSLLNSSDELLKFNLYGFILEYDNNFIANLYNEQLGEDAKLNKCLNLNLENVKPLKTMDGITHIYGTFNNHVTFIGFKTRSGLMNSFGVPNGEPFLLGEYNKELHCLRVQLGDNEGEEGIGFLEPIFKDAGISNKAIDDVNNSDEGLKNYLIEDPKYLLEERYFRYGKKMPENIIKSPMLTTTKEKNTKDKSDKNIYNTIIDDDDDDIENKEIIIEPDDNQSEKEQTENPKESFKEKLKKKEKEKEEVKLEAENYYKKYLDEQQLFPENSIQTQNQSAMENDIPNLNISRIPKTGSPNTYYESPYSSLKKKENVWDGSSLKNIDPKNFLQSKENYNKIIKRLEREIDREITKELAKYDYVKDFNFYDEYLLNHNLLDPYILSPKKFENYSDFKELEWDFYNFSLEQGNEEMNSNEDLYNIKDPNLNYNDNQIVDDWKLLSNKLKQYSKISVVEAIICLYKALQIINNVDDNFYDNKTPLEDKIKIYKKLIKNKYVVNLILNEINPKLIKKVQNKNISEASKSNILKEENELLLDSQDMDMKDVIKKLKILEDLGKQYPKLYPQLSLLYMKYKKIYLYKKDMLKRDKSKEENNDQKSKDVDYERCLKELKKQPSMIKSEPKNKNKKEPKNKTPEITLSEAIKKDGEELPIYKNQKIGDKSTNQKFIDPLFTSTSTTPAPTPNEVKKSKTGNPNNSKMDYPFDSDITLLPVEDIISSPNYTIINDPNALNMEDTFINTGILKNYYFPSAIYALLRYPKSILNLFPSLVKTKNGQYAVKVRMEGVWKYVILDDYFPSVKDIYKNNIFAFSSLIPKNEIYVNLLEKAWAKINGGYKNITQGTVAEIFDLFTNYPTDKIEINALDKDSLSSNLSDAIFNNYIVMAKSNNYKCYQNGFIPETYYIIDSFEEINNNYNDVLIHMINIFGSLKFNGNWSNKNNKWMPSTQNHKILYNEKEKEFYISFDDFINNFSILTYLKINDKDFYKYIHYKKNEVLSPNIIKLTTLENDTKVCIQLHQKNPRFAKAKNAQKKINLIPGFILLAGNKFDYKGSKSSKDQCFNLCLKLEEPGEYYIYTDIFYRYISKSELHGYTVSFNADKNFEIKKDETQNDYYKFLSNVLFSYMNDMDCEENKSLFQNDFEMKVFNGKRDFSKFPFLFKIFFNYSPFPNDINIEVFNKFGNVKNFAMYLDNENLNDENYNNNLLNKRIEPNSKEAVMVLRLTDDLNFDMVHRCNPEVSKDDLIQYVLKNGNKQYLDEDETIVQYWLDYYNGCIILLHNDMENAEHQGENQGENEEENDGHENAENQGENQEGNEEENDDVRMKLLLKGLINPENPKGDTLFYLKNGEYKIFKLITNWDNPSGITSFKFIFV